MGKMPVYYERAFPHGILGWEEEARDFGDPVVTRATRTHVLLTDYWNHNGADDGAWRVQVASIVLVAVNDLESMPRFRQMRPKYGGHVTASFKE